MRLLYKFFEIHIFVFMVHISSELFPEVSNFIEYNREINSIVLTNIKIKKRAGGKTLTEVEMQIGRP